MNAYRYLFGPVPSRRFGRSLGVDLVPSKTCTLNCVFCQLGPTAAPTRERREYVPTAGVIGELEHWVQTGTQADYITLAGSGEPTLHSRFGDVLDCARRLGSFQTALLTNGTTLSQPEVRKAAARADVVKISLSAWDSTSFNQVNRPESGLDFETILAGYRDFRRAFPGQLWMEVFLVPGINTRRQDVQKIADLARDIRPDRIQLNTAVRPPAEKSVQPVNEAEVRRLAELFIPAAEVIAEYRSPHDAPPRADLEAAPANVLALLQRHPATLTEIATAFALSDRETSVVLHQLEEAGQIRREKDDPKAHYVAAD